MGKPFYYDGGKDSDVYYLIVLSDGTPLPGWYFYTSARDEANKADPIGPWDSEAAALAEIARLS